MRNESRIFNGLAGALLLLGGTYAWWTHYRFSEVEWAGTIAFTLAAALLAMCGLYFAFVARRIEPRPEDRTDAEIAEGAGEVGFFSPGSYWPFGIAVAATVAGFGVAYWMTWLIVVGAIGVIMASSAMLFENYSGTRRGID